jgi:hypothetical protein
MLMLVVLCSYVAELSPVVKFYLEMTANSESFQNVKTLRTFSSPSVLYIHLSSASNSAMGMLLEVQTLLSLRLFEGSARNGIWTRTSI